MWGGSFCVLKQAMGFDPLMGLGLVRLFISGLGFKNRKLLSVSDILLVVGRSWGLQEVLRLPNREYIDHFWECALPGVLQWGQGKQEPLREHPSSLVSKMMVDNLVGGVV